MSPGLAPVLDPVFEKQCCLENEDFSVTAALLGRIVFKKMLLIDQVCQCFWFSVDEEPKRVRLAGGRQGNSLWTFFMLSSLHVVLILLNPAGTYTYGGRAHPPGIIPHSRQIKGWDLRSMLHNSTWSNGSSHEEQLTADPHCTEVCERDTENASVCACLCVCLC